MARAFEAAPAAFVGAVQFRNVKPALGDAAHPDHRLAKLLADAAMTRLPLIGRELLYELLTADIPQSVLEAPASADDIVHAAERLFGSDAPSAENLKLPAAPRLRDVYAAIIDTDRFRVACGRISASYAW